ncbi:MAG: hypothetical protein QXR42_09455 [Candidatus Bathyarchaeia archaeon]
MKIKKVWQTELSLLMIVIISISFLVPLAQANSSSTQPREIKTLKVVVNGRGTQYPYVFEIRIETLENGTIVWAEKFTEEQRQRLVKAQKVIIYEGDSYIELLKWLGFGLVIPGVIEIWYIIFGALLHIYIDPITAVNIKTATTVAATLLGAITAALAETPVANVVSFVCSLLATAIAIDYATIYDAEKNPDDTLDIWFECTPINMLKATRLLVVELLTRRYVWWATLVGAYIIRERPPRLQIDPTKPIPNQLWKLPWYWPQVMPAGSVKCPV